MTVTLVDVISASADALSMLMVAGPGSIGFGWQPAMMNVRAEINAMILLSFIERTPSDQRGMVEITLDFLKPFRDEVFPCRRLTYIEQPVRVLAPDHISESVRVIEEPRLEDLLMEPRAVVAASHRKLYVVLQRLIGRRGIDAVRVKALVEYEASEHGFSVNIKSVIVHGYLADAEIALHLVIAELEYQIVQVGIARRPELRLF